MSSVREMRGLLTDQMVTRDQFERYHTEYSNLVVSPVDEAVAPVKQELEDLQVRRKTLESSAHIGSGNASRRASSETPWIRSSIPDYRVQGDS